MNPFIENSVFSAFTDHDDINRGGCGIYALAVARYLMNRGFDKLELIACGHAIDDANTIEIVNNNHIIGNVPNHVVVKAGEYCIDAEGVFEYHNYIEMKANQGKVCVIIDFNEEKLLIAINRKYDWNSIFHRSSFIDEFEKTFNVSLEDVIV